MTRDGDIRELLAHLKRLQPLIGSPDVTQCDVCGNPSDRLLCNGCRGEREAKHLERLEAFDRDFRGVVRGSKERGRLDPADKTWLLAHGCKETVEGLERRFEHDSGRRGTATSRRRSDAGAGFADALGRPK